MKLLQHIKSDRKEKKKKEPYAPPRFNRIAALVTSYSLDEHFLETLDTFTCELSVADVDPGRIRPKPHLEVPLFALLDRDAYRTAQRIMQSVGSPYIHFANSPEEVLLCDPLFFRNSALPPETLSRRHFETLLLREIAREAVRDANQRPAAADGGIEGAAVRGELLEAFIDAVEKNPV